MRTAKKKHRTTEDVLREQEAQAKAARENALTVKKGSTALSADGSNPWIEVSAELDRFIGAPFVRFSKQGEFAISDTETIPAGTRCVAHCEEISFGWRKWLDNKVVDTRMGLVADRFVPAQRRDLGDTDEDQWEIQDDGSRRDPWQLNASVPLTRLDTGETYLFSVSSKGGLRCINGLTRTYGSRVKAKGEAAGNPIVELQPDSYKHRTYGKIFFPLLHVVGWTDASGKLLSSAELLDDDLPDDCEGEGGVSDLPDLRI
jgi:hypothetical protein